MYLNTKPFQKILDSEDCFREKGLEGFLSLKEIWVKLQEASYLVVEFRGKQKYIVMKIEFMSGKLPREMVLWENFSKFNWKTEGLFRRKNLKKFIERFSRFKKLDLMKICKKKLFFSLNPSYLEIRIFREKRWKVQFVQNFSLISCSLLRRKKTWKMNLREIKMRSGIRWIIRVQIIFSRKVFN